MPMQRVQFRPGLNRQVTATQNEGGWTDGNLVRFRDGLPEPIGGWQNLLTTAYAGVGRALRAWATLAGDAVIALGTSSNLYLFKAGMLSDITPTSLLPGGSDVSTTTGWGAGPWNVGTFGTDRGPLVTPSALRLWSLATWGEELIANPRDLGLYNWKPSSGVSSPATALTGTGVPIKVKCVLTGMPERHLNCYGADVGGVQDPMLVRWSDVEDYTVWQATATNSAGSYRLAGGTSILQALGASQEILIWTDETLYAQRFLGLPYVYGFFQQGVRCGALSPGAAAVLGGVAYWMGRRTFWTYAGQVAILSCPVWDAVFRNLNLLQADKVVCGTNAAFGEVSWFFPSLTSAENDRVVTYDTIGRVWWHGAMSRTAWTDQYGEGVGQGTAQGNPLAAAPGGALMVHEVGTDADGGPLDAWVQSGYFDVGDGGTFSFVDEVIPDFNDMTGTLQITLTAQPFPNAGIAQKGPFTVSPTTRHLSPRLRGRQIAMRVESAVVGAFWRLGAVRLRVAGDGRQ